MNLNKTTPGGIQIKVDLDAIDFMKCYCGKEEFIMVHKLKHISPMQCGDPKGASAQFPYWRCLACGQQYPGAMAPDEIEKLRLDRLEKRKVNEATTNA